MSYFDFFTKNINKDSAAINGTCYSMCPKEEATMREKEKLVHVLEVVKSERKLVKSYTRSAADSNMAVPSCLRPYSVLATTLRYLLLEVTKRADVPLSVVYDFVNDRLRAVRQDMTIQRLPPRECCALLEPMVRFHVYFGLKLCDSPIRDYDPVLNQKYLLECLKWFLSSSDTMDLETQQVDDLTGFISGLDINSKHSLKCDRVLVECLYVLCNLDDIHPLRRYLKLPTELKRDPRLQSAYKIAVANLKGNYVAVCRILDTLCPLTACALSLHLPVLQRRSLQVLSVAYNSKSLTVPLEVINGWLRFGNVADAAKACAHYGLQLNGNTVQFHSSQFRKDAATMRPRNVLSDKLDLTIDHIFTY